MRRPLLVTILAIATPFNPVQGQQNQQKEIPITTQWTLNAAEASQRIEISSIVWLYCPTTKLKGTGFILKNGLVVTNDHVVDGCAADRIVGTTSTRVELKFRKLVTDPDVDLAALRPTDPIAGGLELGEDTDPKVGSRVTTWGYPLIHNGPAWCPRFALLLG
jgi:hypothetical protein